MMNNSPNSTPRMQWFILIVVSLWLLMATMLPVVAFCFTNNPLSFSLYGTIAPPAGIMYWLVKRIFPKNDSDLRLDLARIRKRLPITTFKPNLGK